jgi:hypothetical protein
MKISHIKSPQSAAAGRPSNPIHLACRSRAQYRDGAGRPLANDESELISLELNLAIVRHTDMAVTKAGVEKPAPRAFYEFIGSPDALLIFRRWGGSNRRALGTRLGKIGGRDAGLSQMGHSRQRCAADYFRS